MRGRGGLRVACSLLRSFGPSRRRRVLCLLFRVASLQCARGCAFRLLFVCGEGARGGRRPFSRLCHIDYCRRPISPITHVHTKCIKKRAPRHVSVTSSRLGHTAHHHPPLFVVASPSFSWLRLRMIILLEYWLVLRVRRPFVYQPHGDDDGRPPELFPSPPPIGWSTAFIATPRVFDRLPIQALAPALPSWRFLC